MEKSLHKLNQHQKHELWSQRVAACRSSGVPVRQWCQENGVAEKTYYYWQRRLFEAAKAAAEPDFVQLVVPEEHRTGAAAVVSAGSLRIEILNGAEPSTLQAIFNSLPSC